ncbi:short-chain dehydrogenase TIC 32, chloroplastic-like [Papaver somniferum]|uniref:short-chain dehydrogenase TIC 32, chloroplastic-like n=1 Tax=Papaver somniferum TaxID=3469 RepID=UPI000E7027B2|nr:short-chain dehydrogenase TIC 32, chloroplastic-like [Papaver somniferum]
MWFFSRKGSQSGFSAYNTAEEVTHGIDASGLTAIVTGSSNGIGAETARVLAMRGVQVVIAVRNTSAGMAVKETLVKETPSAKVYVLELDLSSMASVRKFVSEFKALSLPLNILINNAGAICPYKLSPDNIELQFATNCLGHFLLTDLLLETMKWTASRGNIEGKIINVSSEGYKLAYREGIRFDKLNDESWYNRFGAYGQSKLANILHANELSRRLKEDGMEITANSLHPGAIVTNLWHNSSTVSGWLTKAFGSTVEKLLVKNVKQGASTTCYAALHPNVKGVSGKYFVDNNISVPNAQATDTELAKKLWDFSMTLIHQGRKHRLTKPGRSPPLLLVKPYQVKILPLSKI